ncbi:putative NADPH-dependent quinone reductase tdiC [Fulvia fulva]|uniref:NADPH-dependent quinone reductase tdiC n=1 Tax=Passalora fulva TaxID=5499 RepID=A0A9Q8L8W0_PASFU|nr:putative NADPH-dependent quinone reductase tdiC [Fulvia fulva]UJO13070.1 putative NADPH-dependent quinone reductase tdiC [Fulvia fulva]
MNIQQAQITTWGSTPTLQTITLPPPAPSELRIKALAIGIHRVVRSRAAGSHYSAKTLPHTPGIDGVGLTDDDQKVYFLTFGTGTLAEYVNMPKSAVYPLDPGVDPVQVAASINPAMSSWMAFKGRTRDLPKGFTVLILGVTSASGRVAVPLARALGAGRVFGAARNEQAMEKLGLDRRIVIAEKAEETEFGDLDDVDVVLDYVYGLLAVHLFNSLKTPKPVQYVHIGALSEPEITIPGGVLRSKDITIRGSGPGAWSMKAFAETLPELLSIIPGIPEQPVEVAKFEELEEKWKYDGPKRLVFVP